MSKFIPTVPEMVRETIIVVVGTLAAAYLISRFPALQKLVNDNSVQVKTN